MARTPRLESLSTRARLVIGLAIGLLVAGLVLAGRSLRFLQGLEYALVDLRTKVFAGDRPPDPRIVLAEVSDQDVLRLQCFSPWPWPLHYNAAAIRALTAAGAKVVMVDVYHLDKGAGLEDKPSEGCDEAFYAASVEEGDDLGAAYGEHGAVAIAFMLADFSENEVEARIGPSAERRVPPGVSLEPGLGIVRPRARLPVSRAAQGARVVAFGNLEPDSDGVARRGATVGRWGERTVVSLPLAAAALATDGPKEVREREIRLGDAVQRLHEDGTFLVNFRGPPMTFPRRSVADLVGWGFALAEGKPLPPEATAIWKDKIVVWGIWLAGQEDNVSSPFGTTHGPEFQATVLDNLLHGDGRVYAPPWLNLAVLLGTCVILGIAGMTLPMRWAGVVSVATLALGVAFAFWLFGRGTSLDIVVPMLGAMLTWTATAGFRMLTEGKRNRWLEGTFGLYLAPEIIQVLKEDPTRLQLGGRRHEITVLFSDIAGFTKFSEKLPPDQLTTLLNRYLSLHAGAVMAEGGVVDKFIGDAVMAFFGDPLDAPGHALQACRSALAAVAIPPTLDPYCRELGIPGLRIRVGINSGQAVVGNMGSDKRFAYTAMGDTVNLASRLESANKAFGSTIMMGSLTYEQAKEHVVARPLAELVVVGKQQAVPVYELLGLVGRTPPDVVALAEAFTRAQRRARAGDLDGAAAALEECARIRPGDGPTSWFRDRLRAMSSGEEPTPWSGRFVLESK